MAIHNLFVPRARLATFNVQLRIEDLNNVPPLNGLFYVKWRLQDYSGSTPRAPVVNREVRWSQAVEKSADISIAKEGVLAPCELKISIKQEVYPHVHMRVGALTVNLSEYARLSGSSRRYFLQECRLNCTLKLSICVSQSGGPDSYDVPPLDRSMVLTDLNDMITNENNARGGRENSSMGNSFSSKQHSAAHNYRKPANSATSVHTNTTRSNTTETSQSRALLPIDNTNVRELAPFQRSSKKNQQIIDDVFFSPPTLPS
ncbi:hypothetical protein H4R27_001052 [Coemansia aciculifera]|uniref:C2 NT-type domain-containing protein n=1 Tax=Coemansia pectinata TaxID=1052879 RepID=A0A9W8H672_9FUNG|nr:hypothetical protein GGI19_000744 [Coemansia pectinata]KAJ2885917.1 hypothetical protein H4R27_001052 [Coemansia aciculifera]